METITLEEALDSFKLPRTLGDFEDKPISVGVGRFGPYVRHNNAFVSIPKDTDPMTVSLEDAIDLIMAKREQVENKVIKTFQFNCNFYLCPFGFGAKVTAYVILIYHSYLSLSFVPKIFLKNCLCFA